MATPDLVPAPRSLEPPDHERRRRMWRYGLAGAVLGALLMTGASELYSGLTPRTPFMRLQLTRMPPTSASPPRRAYLIGVLHRTVKLPTHRKMRLFEFLGKSGALGPDVTFTHITLRRLDATGTPIKLEFELDEIRRPNAEGQDPVIDEGDIVRLQS